MAYSMGEAAKALGLSKPTVSKYIKQGKISAARHEDGGYSIDPAELQRFQASYVKPSGGKPPAHAEPVLAEAATGLELLQQELAHAKERIADLEAREARALAEAAQARDRAHEVTIALGTKLLAAEGQRKKLFGLF